MLKKIAYFIIAIFLPFCFSLFSYQAFAEEEATRPQDVCEASIDPELRQSFGCEDFEDNNTLPITITNIVKNTPCASRAREQNRVFAATLPPIIRNTCVYRVYNVVADRWQWWQIIIIFLAGK